MIHELRYHREAIFATLTYDDKHLPPRGTLVKRDVQLFLKRLRKNTGKKIRYFIGGEYGERTKRPHYHGIFYGLSRDDLQSVLASWSNGHIHGGDVTAASCQYVAKYINKKLYGLDSDLYRVHGLTPEFSLMSRRPGIGDKFVEEFGEEMKKRGFNYHEGKKVGLPKFYRKRLFKEGERDFKTEKYIFEKFEKSLDKIREIGYGVYTNQEKLRRQHAIDAVEGYGRLRVKKL